MKHTGFAPPTLASVISSPSSLVRYPTFEAAVIYFAFLAWIFACSHLIPGAKAFGLPLANGKRIQYTMNGLRCLLVTMLTYFVASYVGLLSPTILYDNYGPLASLVLIFCFFVSFYLYISAFLFKRTGHITGNIFMDWWMGVELNPFFGGLDLKVYALRPALIGWMMLNLSVAAKQWETYGEIKLPMLLFLFFSGVYIVDYFYFEPLILSTWDIIAENWGFMLVFGDLFFIPFAFSIQTFYLLDREEYNVLFVALNCALFFLGFYIFRLANWQKDSFKQNPKAKIWGKEPEMIQGKLLVSGWWGLVRKPNYTGDMLIAISFSLPCGFDYLIPYLYPFYLIPLLFHRAARDNYRCSQKYGKVWSEYCARVPYTFIPGIY